MTHFLRQRIAHDNPIAPRFLAEICPSSWVSWSCFGIGLMLAMSPAAAADLVSGGPGFVALAGAIAMFFLATILIQRHMRLSLLSGHYGRPDRLITSGVFGFSRNPIYVAFLMPLAAIGVYSLAAAAVAIFAYLVTMTQIVIRREEAELTRRFGAQYTEYAARTPRWLFV